MTKKASVIDLLDSGQQVGLPQSGFFSLALAVGYLVCKDRSSVPRALADPWAMSGVVSRSVVVTLDIFVEYCCF